jgi:hypothetical protein
VPTALSAKNGAKTLSCRYSFSWADVDGDKIPELVMRRSEAQSKDYGAYELPGEPGEPIAVRERVFQVRDGALHELPRAIAACPRTGDAGLPLQFARREHVPAEIMARIEQATGATFEKDAPDLRCALWDHYFAGGETPVAWVQTETGSVPAPGVPVWLEPAGPKTRVAWFRTVEGNAARLTWDGSMLQVIEPNIPPTVPIADDDAVRPVNKVQAVDALVVNERLMLFMDVLAGTDRRAIVYDPVTLELLVNQPIKSAASFHDGILTAANHTFRYDPKTKSWKKK